MFNMMKRHLIQIFVISFLGLCDGAIAQQVVPDASLNTQVTSADQRNFVITNGSAARQNLFHSFREFSIPTNGSATFNLANSPNISTILNRVTGNTASSIDGTIRTTNTNNPVSIFLINPNGIVFGANAKLNISGSFIASTASSVKFDDGSEFNTAPTPLLTISAGMPANVSSLQFGQSQGSIRVQGTGHTLQSFSIFAPLQQVGASSGLSVQPQTTIALIGGQVELDGGVISAPSGRIEIGAVGTSAQVQLKPIASGWQFNYPGSQFQDIRFSNKAAVNASGAGGSRIYLQGRHISFQDGSIAFINNVGDRPAGSVEINATESVLFSGTSQTALNVTSGVWSQTLGRGAGADILISAPQLALRSGAKLQATTLSSAAGGTIQLSVPQSIQVTGLSPFDLTNPSGIYATTNRAGQGGNIEIATGHLVLAGGVQLLSTTLGSGQGGNVRIDATDVELRGFNAAVGITTNLGLGSLAAGDAGELTLNTKRLSISDGANVVGSTFAAGRAGSITINATESVSVSGVVQARELLTPSSINSSATIATAFQQQFLRLPPAPTGSAGDVSINTPSLHVANGGTIAVRNQGSGNGGTLTLNTEKLALDRRAKILADTRSGEGGNINARAAVLTVRGNSEITSTAGGSGNGGNIAIAAQFLIQTGNSDITANATKGRGGNVFITTQGLFGGMFRPQLTPESDITASSQFGMSGSVSINTPGVNPNSGLVELPIDLINSDQQIAAGCAAARQNQFVITGRGGLPPNPTQRVRGDRPWADLRDRAAASASAIEPLPALAEATAWYRHSDGNVELVAAQPVPSGMIATCTIAP